MAHATALKRYAMGTQGGFVGGSGAVPRMRVPIVRPAAVVPPPHHHDELPTRDTFIGALAHTPASDSRDVDERYHHLADIHAYTDGRQHASLDPVTRGARWLLVRGGIVGWVLAAIAAFALIGFAWYAVWRWALPQSVRDDDSLRSLFSAIDFVVGLLYFMWLGDVFEGFKSPFASYNVILHRVHVLVQDVYIFVLRSRAHAAATTAVDHATLGALEQSLYGMIVYAYRLFSEDDPHVTLQEYVPVGGDVSHEIAAWTGVFSVASFDVFEGFLSIFERRLAVLEDRLVVKPADMAVIDRTVASIRAQLEAIDKNMHVRMPNVFRYHILFVLFVYFFCWLPASMMLRFHETALVVYPLVTFLLFGFFVYKSYLGPPFAAPVSFTRMDPVAWRRTALESTRRAAAAWTRAALPATTAAAPLRAATAVVYASAHPHRFDDFQMAAHTMHAARGMT